MMKQSKTWMRSETSKEYCRPSRSSEKKTFLWRRLSDPGARKCKSSDAGEDQSTASLQSLVSFSQTWSALKKPALAVTTHLIQQLGTGRRCRSSSETPVLRFSWPPTRPILDSRKSFQLRKKDCHRSKAYYRKKSRRRRVTSDTDFADPSTSFEEDDTSTTITTSAAETSPEYSLAPSSLSLTSSTSSHTATTPTPPPPPPPQNPTSRKTSFSTESQNHNSTDVLNSKDQVSEILQVIPSVPSHDKRDEASTQAASARYEAKELREEQHLRYYVDLSGYYEQLGDVISSLSVLEQALAVCTVHVGNSRRNNNSMTVFEDNLRIAYLLYRSGRLQWKMGHYLDSQARLIQARHLYEQELLGQVSENLVEVYAALGQVARSMGDVKQAKRQYMKALKAIEFNSLFYSADDNNNNNQKEAIADHGPMKVLQAKVLRQLGILLLDCEKHKDAGTALLEAARMQQILLGCWHVEYASTLLALGQYYEAAQHDYAKAAGAYLDALDIYKSQKFDCRVDMAVTLSRIGWLYFLAQNFGEARASCQEAYDLIVAALGNNHRNHLHVNIASIHLQIGMIYESTKQWDRALKRYNRALEIQSTIHGNNHESVAVTMCLISSIYRQKHVELGIDSKEGQFCLNQAWQFLNHAMHIRGSLFGRYHVSVGKTLVQLSELQYQSGLVRQAAESISMALDIYHRNSLPTSHYLVEQARALVKQRSKVRKNCQSRRDLQRTQTKSLLHSHVQRVAGTL